MAVKVRGLLEELFVRYPKLKQEENNILQAYEILKYCYQNGGKVLTCGNGGSAADAGHVTAELMKGFLISRGLTVHDTEKFSSEYYDFVSKLQYGLPAISLSAQSELITAISNDNGAEMVFAQQVFAYGRKNDVLICISTSGDSENVINAARVAKCLGVKTVALTGKKGGTLKCLADVAICAPETVTYKIQEQHLPIYHVLCSMLEMNFFGGTE